MAMLDYSSFQFRLLLLYAVERTAKNRGNSTFKWYLSGVKRSLNVAQVGPFLAFFFSNSAPDLFISVEFPPGGSLIVRDFIAEQGHAHITYVKNVPHLGFLF